MPCPFARVFEDRAMARAGNKRLCMLTCTGLAKAVIVAVFVVTELQVCAETAHAEDGCDTQSGLCNLSGRRRFPAPPHSLGVGSINAQRPPVCEAAEDRGAGCVAWPRSVRPPVVGSTEQMHWSPPNCTTGADSTRHCKQGLPRSRNKPPFSLGGAVLEDLADYFGVVSVPDLESGNAEGAMALGDVDRDGWLDAVVATRSQTRLLRNDGRGHFEPAVSLPGSSSGSLALALGDVNGDGWLDVVVGNYETANQLLLNDGAGGFPTATALPGSIADVWGLAAGDVDGDGHVDLVGHWNDANWLLRNDGVGGFNSAVELPGAPVGTGAIDGLGGPVALGSLDHYNDRLDVVIAENGWVKILFNNGFGEFQPIDVVAMPAGTQNPVLALGDLNGDGWIDVVLGGLGVTILLNDRGTDVFFSAPLTAADVLGGYWTKSVELGDVDGDGSVDIVLGKGGATLLLLNNGSAHFETAVELSSSAGDAIALADVDGDGRRDVVLATGGASVVLLLNKGNASFPTAVELPGRMTTPSSIEVGDVNRDGWLDLVIVDGGGANKVYLNDRAGGFQPAADLPGGGLRSYDLVLEDMNGDGWLDIVVGNVLDPLQLYLNDRSGGFPALVELPVGKGYTRSVALGDVDNNGWLDIVLAMDRYSVDPLRVLNNSGDGTFKDIVATLPVAQAGTVNAIALGDLDLDGFDDLVVATSGQNQWFRNNHVGGFEPSVELPGAHSSVRTSSVALGDVDGDGDVDVVLGNKLDANVLHRNDGAGGFQLEVMVDGDTPTFAISMADLDGDGWVDVVVGNTDSPNQWLHNDGGRGFEPALDLPGGSEPTSGMALGDIDQDGSVDVVFRGSGGANALLLNRVKGLFEAPVDLPGGQRSHVISLGDVDGDGWLDVVVGNWDGANELLLNDGAGNFESAIDLPGSSDLATVAVGLGDIDGDGWLDMVVANSVFVPLSPTYSTGAVQSFRNNRTGGFHSAVELPGRVQARALVLGDVNGDGWLDVVVGYYSRNVLNEVLLNDGFGRFPTAMQLPQTSRSDGHTLGLVLGDLNADGSLDLLVNNLGAGSMGSVQVLFNNGTGSFAESQTPTWTGPNALAITVGDFDGDGFLDTVEAKTDSSILVWLNRGTGTLVGSATTFLSRPSAGSATAIAAADVDGDGRLDIVVGNTGGANLWARGDGAGGFEVLELPGGSTASSAIAVGDVDADGRVDLIVGNSGGANQMLRGSACPRRGAQWHGASWCFGCPEYMGRTRAACVECLPDSMQQPGPGELCSTEPCPLGERALGEDSCRRCDGRVGVFYRSVLERLESDASTWVTPRCAPCSPGTFSDGTLLALDVCFSCPAGTYQPEGGGSACLRCPPGMFQAERGAISCVPCRAGGYCASAETCGGGFTECPAGTYNPFNGSSSPAACEMCEAGTYSAQSQATSADACLRCRPGTFAASRGMAECKECAAGSFQPSPGATRCDPCLPGNFCPTGAAAPLPCPAGTRVNLSLPVMRSRQDCVICPAGSFCPPASHTPSPCAPGSHAAGPGLGKCDLCPPGSYSGLGATLCLPCEAGTYSANAGQGACIPCPGPLSSGAAAVQCAVCNAGYFLASAEASPSDMLKQPDLHCRPCPPHAGCPANSSLASFVVPPHFWRDSLASTQLFACNSSAAPSAASPCLGSNHRGYADAVGSDARYCAPGHRGPRCQVCTEPGRYFSPQTLRCERCSTSSKLGLLAGVVLGLLSLVALARWLSDRHPAVMRMTRRVTTSAAELSLQAKFKILISFYQVFNTLPLVYGVEMHPDFARWLNVLSLANLDVLEFALPASCLGLSMGGKLVASALAPFILSLLVCTVLVGRSLLVRSAPDVRAALGTSKHACILILYLVLPSVSRTLFSAIQCQSFGTTRSYLVADLRIRCDSDSADFKALSVIFFLFFAIWPVLIPLAFLRAVLKIWPSVRAQHITDEAKSCSFLWQDYGTRTIYWEVVDLVRKLVLTALILFVDVEHGSSKLLRLVVATIISASYLTMLALTRPHKRRDDLFLACASNLCLVCSFVAGLTIKLCERGPWPNSCYAMVGLSGTLQTTEFLVALTALMLAGTLLVIAADALSAAAAPTIRVAATGRPPILELPPACNFHCFLSHAWGTGQDQTHSIARQLQLLVPGIKVWLDVDQLADVGRLEEAVGGSAVLVIFLSKGYFLSPNCRRELYAALGQRKPIAAVHEANAAKGGASLLELMAECRQHCTDVAPASHPEYTGPEEAVARVFPPAEEPVVWVRVADFQRESLKLLAHRMFRHLPHYLAHPEELDGGLSVPGEFAPASFASDVTLFVCPGNEGAWDLAEELQAAAQHGKGRVVLQDAHAVLGVGDGDVVGGSPGQGRVGVEVGGAGEGERWRGAQRKRGWLLLYLTARCMGDEGVVEAVHRALLAGVPLVLVHEQDPERGGCAFRQILSQTPRTLLLPPHRLFDTVAVPLHSSPAHRKVSLQRALQCMGARPSRPPLSQRLSQRLSRALAQARPDPERGQRGEDGASTARDSGHRSSVSDAGSPSRRVSSVFLLSTRPAQVHPQPVSELADGPVPWRGATQAQARAGNDGVVEQTNNP